VRLLTDISLLTASLTLDAVLAAVSAILLLARRRAQRERDGRPRRVSGRYGRVTVDRSKITADMHVPALDGTGHVGDYECGDIAATLFKSAMKAGALAAPAGVQIACFPDHDIIGGGFVLVAFPDGDGSAWGTTTGYYDASVVGTIERDETNDPSTVALALRVFARELNTSLAGLEAHVRQARSARRPRRSWRRSRARRATVQPAANHREETILDDPRRLLLAVKDAGECVELILQQATVAPDGEIPGLISAIECLLSLDERDAGRIVEQASRRHG
jgi:hypothetical protein